MHACLVLKPVLEVVL